MLKSAQAEELSQAIYPIRHVVDKSALALSHLDSIWNVIMLAKDNNARGLSLIIKLDDKKSVLNQWSGSFDKCIPQLKKVRIFTSYHMYLMPGMCCVIQ